MASGNRCGVLAIAAVGLRFWFVLGSLPTTSAFFPPGNEGMPPPPPPPARGRIETGEPRSGAGGTSAGDGSLPEEATHRGGPQDTEGLVFEGTFRCKSDLVPMPAPLAPPGAAGDLFEFFSDPGNRDLVLKGGGNRCERVPLTPELREEWISQSRIVRSTPPVGNARAGAGGGHHRNEEVLAVYSEVPIAPGLSLRAVSYTGCKTMRDATTALPYYEFTLLKETYRPVGKKAMTWIFDRVMGSHGDRIRRGGGAGVPGETGTDVRRAQPEPGGGSERGASGDDGGPKAYALSRVTLEPLPGDGGCKICYYGHVRLSLSKRFLHMLPLPIGVVRSRVNRSIKRQLERECTRSIEKFQRALCEWNETNNAHQQR